MTETTDLHDQMLQKWEAGDREGAQRLLNEINGAAEPEDGQDGSEGGEGHDWPRTSLPAAPESREHALARAREGVAHLAELDPSIVPEFLHDVDASGQAFGDMPDVAAVAQDYADRIESRDLNGEWDFNARPPEVSPEIAAAAAESLPSDLHGDVGYILAASNAIAARWPDLMQKLMADDPDAPGRMIADRESIVRTAARYGRLLVHTKPAKRAGPTPKGNTMNAKTEPAPSGEDIDTLISQKLSALASGNQTKAAKLEKRIVAHFTARYGDEPAVGSGGRYV